MGKEKGFSLSPVKTSAMRRFLQREGYAVQPGHHKHVKLKHETAALYSGYREPGWRRFWRTL